MVGSVTHSFMSRNISSIRTVKEDMTVVTVMLMNLAMELEKDQGNTDIVTLFNNFGKQLNDLHIGPAGSLLKK